MHPRNRLGAHLRHKLEKELRDEQESAAVYKEYLDSFGGEQQPQAHIRPQKKEIDKFLEELKQNQEGHCSSSLFISNIALDASEHDLYQVFGVFGDLAGIRILPAKRDLGACIVSFMRRADASEALSQLQSTEFKGHALKITWAKPVPIPDYPTFLKISRHIQQVNVSIPAFESIRIALDALALYTLDHGQDLSEFNFNAYPSCDFGFLKLDQTTKLSDPLCVYYLWKTYSLAHGDSLKEWSSVPYQVNGVTWHPPSSIEARSATFSKALIPSDRQVFDEILKRLSLERRTICDGMMFAIEHSEQAAEVIEAIVQSMKENAANAHSLFARVYLLSDLLYNSSSPTFPMAWKIEGNMKVIVSTLRDVFLKAGRMTAASIQERFGTLFEIWKEWSIYPEATIDAWRLQFLGEEVAIAPILEEKAPIAPCDPNDIEGVPISSCLDEIRAVLAEHSMLRS